MSSKPGFRLCYFILELCVCQILFAQVPATAVPQEHSEKPSRGGAPKEVIDWFRSTAIPLKTTSPDGDLEDMSPLSSVIGDARIVAMGEATHGTREFFRMKHRMLEFLTEKMGFTVFAIEANWPESLAVNDYVLNGKGDPAAALAGMYFWTWNTEEVLDMIRWMRTYNENPAHTRKLKFLGFDMQTARVAVSNVEEYLQKVDPEESRLAAKILAPLADKASEAEYSKKPDEMHRETAKGIKTIFEKFSKRKLDYVASSSTEEWAMTQHNLEIVREAEQLHSSRSSGLRDHFMAENVKWILDSEPAGTKIMLWAHNGHISTDPSAMGSVLRQTYAREMVVCAFSFYQGSFQAIGGLKPSLRDFIVGPPPADTVDSTLADTGLPLFVLDFRAAAGNSIVREWLATPHRMRSIGAVYNELSPASYFASVTASTFDVIFFVNRSTPARENRNLPHEMDIDFDRS